MRSQDQLLHSLPPRVRWPIVGRERETATLTARLASGSRGVVVAGPPGLGKTTLVAAALRDFSLAEPAARVLQLSTHHSNSSPMSVFAGLLDSLAHGALTGSPAEVAGQLAAVLQPDSGAAPLLHADDLHLFDPASVAVLAELLTTHQVRMIGTVRVDPGMPTAIDALWRAGVLDRMDLEPLNYESVGLILKRAMPGPVSNDMAFRLWSSTAGNPLHVRELLYSIVEAGDVVFAEYAWVWTAPLRTNRRLTDLLVRDITALTGAEREIVDLVSLAEEVPVCAVMDMADDHVVRSLVERGLVTIDTPSTGLDAGKGAPQVRMGHPLYAETLRSLLYPQRRRELFKLLPKDEFHTQGAVGISRWVDWALECAVDVPAGPLILAAEAAESLSQPARAADLATLALNHAGIDDADRVTALLLRARAYRDTGKTGPAEADVSALGVLVDAGDDAAVAVVAPLARLSADLFQFHHNDLDTALHILALAEKSVDPASDTATELAIDQLSRLGFAGRLGEFLTGIQAQLAVSDHPANLTLAPAHIFGLGQAGKAEQALGLSMRYLAQVGPEHAAFPTLRTAILASRFWAAMWLGDPAQAAYFPDLPEIENQRHDSAIYQTGTGYAALLFGAFEPAIAEFRGALSRFSLGAPTGLEPVAWAGLAHASACRGDADVARQARAEYLRLSAEAMDRSVEVDSRYRILLAELALGEEDLPASVAEYVQWCRESGMATGVLWGLHLAVMVAPNKERAAWLPALAAAAQDVEGKVPGAMLDHAKALVDGDAGIILTAVAELNAAGVWIPAALTKVKLTGRQREIAQLVTAGLSNKSIAEKLTLSVRTVDTHVAHIFQRLGITSRAELAQRLNRIQG